jgi:membrane protein implicated in regulation of membrane protease activity
MPNETKIVKGGFRATLALIISIIAVVLSIMAYNRSGGSPDLNAQVKELKEKMGTIRQDMSKQVDTLRDETAKTLDTLSESLKTKEK